MVRHSAHVGFIAQIPYSTGLSGPVSSTQPHSQSPKLEPFTDVIDAILEGDLGVPRKQRHTVQRIFGRLRDEHGFGGQYTILKDYVREHCRQSRQCSGRCANSIS